MLDQYDVIEAVLREDRIPFSPDQERRLTHFCHMSTWCSDDTVTHRVIRENTIILDDTWTQVLMVIMVRIWNLQHLVAQ